MAPVASARNVNDAPIGAQAAAPRASLMRQISRRLQRRHDHVDEHRHPRGWGVHVEDAEGVALLVVTGSLDQPPPGGEQDQASAGQPNQGASLPRIRYACGGDASL
jgi:hypothetical protein